VIARMGNYVKLIMQIVGNYLIVDSARTSGHLRSRGADISPSTRTAAWSGTPPLARSRLQRAALERVAERDTSARGADNGIESLLATYAGHLRPRSRQRNREPAGHLRRTPPLARSRRLDVLVPARLGRDTSARAEPTCRRGRCGGAPAEHLRSRGLRRGHRGISARAEPTDGWSPRVGQSSGHLRSRGADSKHDRTSCVFAGDLRWGGADELLRIRMMCGCGAPPLARS
jgi:hypothetical protein